MYSIITRPEDHLYSTVYRYLRVYLHTRDGVPPNQVPWYVPTYIHR